MLTNKSEILIPSVKAIKNLLEPILLKLDHIDSVIKRTPLNPKSRKYYRNSDLKNIFGLSSNTIIKYRETGVLPYTKLGEVYLYEVKVIDSILKENSSK
ncbi:helix-turn-helix domain-containing protein [Flavivirga spongiicola]|uniref:Helix-turn-helix domain-containing protein n=1 Tax=Flavivirga spongiicola TaxID=421621 RepID=A0ABU7Y0V9_9FLAO|nr:helix-turn-helix domain-containing protein [Flavivirga sp. MEBiC05379]MDO5980896.1 helix-turn-helix domain-containing protein [Flavivirga sp. MEBiC05379]